MTANVNEKPGCLSIFLPFLGRSSQKTAETLPYRLRDDFLSPAKFSFYKVLSHLVGARLTVQSKVRLADIFFVARPNENMTYFSRIAQKHLDFLICDSQTMKPLLGIELDDSSHKRDNQQERDEFVEKVFETAKLPLLHVPAQREYNPREIAAQIAPLLKDKASATAPQPRPQVNQPTDSLPLCPKCGIPMVLRTVAQGEHKGKQFYGCSNYPRCREMKAFIVKT
jgi:hypothetical protein